jgi:hypothetical protein
LSAYFPPIRPPGKADAYRPKKQKPYKKSQIAGAKKTAAQMCRGRFSAVVRSGIGKTADPSSHIQQVS